MRCPNHLLREAVGYCKLCGQFGCADCLHFHEGEYYCNRDFKPIQDQLDRAKKNVASRHRAERQRLIVHTKKGELAFGFCLALNPEHESFKLELVTPEGTPVGQSQAFFFKDLKAVFYVKSYDGEYDRTRVWNEQAPDGAGIVLEFLDGEIMKGHTYQAYHNEAPRFHFIPEDSEGNNISVLVERSALRATYTPEEYHDLKKRELKEYVKAHMEPGKDTEELIGDYYYSKKDPHRAAGHYYKAVQSSGQTAALLKKIVVSEYNTAMQYIRERHLTHALHHLEKARKLDPENETVLQRIAQIRQKLHLDRTAGRVSVGE